jgi:tetratricopeptide (TPR) repeat protein
MNELALVEDLINHGRYLEARERTLILRNDSAVDTLRVNQLLALSTSKCGSPEVAAEYLVGLYERFPEDSETAGILGGIYKSIFRKQQSTRYALLSRDTYEKNFKQTGNYYTGINAATMSVIAGKAQQGRELATELILKLENTAANEWEWATLAEAYLLTKNRDNAISAFTRARQLITNDWGKVLSVYNQLWLLNHYMPVPKEVLKIFAPPVVVAFTGHMIDVPGRETLRFPAAIEQQVKQSIKAALNTLNASVGYCSLACGADILFAEAMAERGGEVQVILPFAETDFIKISVAFAGTDWVQRFKTLQSKYPNVILTHEGYGGNDDLFVLLGKSIFGSAILRSRSYQQEPFLLTVLSEFDLKRKEGGTRDILQLWPFLQRHTNINPDPWVVSLPLVGSGQKVEVVVDRIAGRPVLYQALLDLGKLIPTERATVIKSVKAKLEAQPSVKLLQEFAEVMVIGMDSEISLMDLVRAVWNDITPLKQEKPIRVVLQVSPVNIKDVANDTNIRNLMAVGRLIPNGSLYATTTMASVLALYSRKFQLEQVGSVKADAEIYQDLFMVEFMR